MATIQAIDVELADARNKWLHATWRGQLAAVVEADDEINDLLDQRLRIVAGVPPLGKHRVSVRPSHL
jgi:hypothetical protein